jgi:hypothetical protein
MIRLNVLYHRDCNGHKVKVVARIPMWLLVSLLLLLGSLQSDRQGICHWERRLQLVVPSTSMGSKTVQGLFRRL